MGLSDVHRIDTEKVLHYWTGGCTIDTGQSRNTKNNRLTGKETTVKRRTIELSELSSVVAASADPMAEYKEIISGLKNGTVEIVERDDNETLQGLKLNLTRSANELKVAITYSDLKSNGADGKPSGVAVYLDTSGKPARTPRSRRNGAVTVTPAPAA